MRFVSVPVFILDIFLSLLTYPFILIIVGPVLLYRLAVIAIVKLCYPSYIPGGLIDQTVQYDYFAKKNEPLIFSTGAVVTVHGPVCITRLQERWREQFLEARDSTGKLVYPKLSVTLVSFGGYIFFKPLKKVNVDDIFRVENLDPKDLEEFKTSFLCSKYKKDGPLWEVVVIQLEQETKMLYRFHHTIADGYTQLYLLNQSMKQNVQQVRLEKEPEYTYNDRVSQLFKKKKDYPRLVQLYGMHSIDIRLC